MMVHAPSLRTPGRALTGYRHELQLMEPRWAGHIRAVVWAGIVAALVVGFGR